MRFSIKKEPFFVCSELQRKMALVIRKIEQIIIEDI